MVTDAASAVSEIVESVVSPKSKSPRARRKQNGASGRKIKTRKLASSGRKSRRVSCKVSTVAQLIIHEIAGNGACILSFAVISPIVFFLFGSRFSSRREVVREDGDTEPCDER